MKMRIVVGLAGVGGTTIVAAQMLVAEVGPDVQATAPTVELAHRVVAPGNAPSNAPEASGPVADLFVRDISGMANYGLSGDFRSYSVGSGICNQGTVPLAWDATSDQSPLIGQSMFRLAPGNNGHDRLEMIGQSWLKRGVCALNFPGCGTCEGTPCDTLGVGCSDAYSASLNGSQGGLGPKYEVNASTGLGVFPPAGGTGITGTTSRRLRVADDDIAAGTTSGHRFFVEVHCVHPQDAPEDDDDAAANNASHREVNINSLGNVVGFIGLTQEQLPAVYAWPDADPLVSTTIIEIPGEGRAVLMYRAYDNEDDTWDYEYLLYNQNFDRAFHTFSVPVPDSVVLTNVSFNDVDYHSGDGIGDQNFDGTDWTSTHTGGVLTWSTDDFATNDSANALRWGTAYNFRFTANAEPQINLAGIDAYRNGAVNQWNAAVATPCGDCGVPPLCAEDLDGSGDVGFSDILQIIGVWGCTTCPAEDLSGNGTVDFADILAAIGAWGPCPCTPLDYFHTNPDEETQVEFGTPDLPTLPADFFDPGSDPFVGQIKLVGFGDFHTDGLRGLVDTVVARSAPIDLSADPIGAQATVGIELVELSLVSAEPVVVTTGGAPENWCMSMGLSANQQSGQLNVIKTHATGGDATSNIPIKPRLAFANENDIQQLDAGLIPPDQVRVRILDFDQDGLPPINLSWSAPMPWSTQPPPGGFVCAGETFFLANDTSPGDNQLPPHVPENSPGAAHFTCPPPPPPPGFCTYTLLGTTPCFAPDGTVCPAPCLAPPGGMAFIACPIGACPDPPCPTYICVIVPCAQPDCYCIAFYRCIGCTI